MDCCSVVSEVVVDCYFDYVTPACLDPGTWVLLVEDFAVGIVDAVTVDVLVRYVEVILQPSDTIRPNKKDYLPLSRYLQDRSSRSQCVCQRLVHTDP